jgi:hypothetical protein
MPISGPVEKEPQLAKRLITGSVALGCYHAIRCFLLSQEEESCNRSSMFGPVGLWDRRRTESRIAAAAWTSRMFVSKEHAEGALRTTGKELAGQAFTKDFEFVILECVDRS